MKRDASTARLRELQVAADLRPDDRPQAMHPDRVVELLAEEEVADEVWPSFASVVQSRRRMRDVNWFRSECTDGSNWLDPASPA